MTRVVFDPRLLATGIAYAGTPARQLLVVAGYSKLVAAARCSDADLAARIGGTLMGAPTLEVTEAEIAGIAKQLPEDIPDGLALIASRPLLDATVHELAAFFQNYPPLRAAAAGVRPEPLVADMVPVPPEVRETQDQLLYCGLEAAHLVVSDRHPIVVASGGARAPVEDRMSGRNVVVLGSAALAGEIGAPLRAVRGELLKDICALLRPGRHA